VKIYNPVQANKSAYFELLQMDVKTFNQSNPWYIDAYINGSDRTYLLLHKDKAERYNSVKDSLQHWDEIMRIREAEEAARLLQEQLSKKKEITYTVKKGDALGLIADKHGVSISDLKNWNSLRKDMIYIGQKLVIFSESGNHKTESDAQEETKSESVIYTVKSGDTLWTIAQKYPGVSADDIMEWNEIDEDIRPGQKLKIYKN
jgi:membrane-bound lytic murein transglycosylase D